jgi:hypothetical protein
MELYANFELFYTIQNFNTISYMLNLPEIKKKSKTAYLKPAYKKPEAVRELV